MSKEIPSDAERLANLREYAKIAKPHAEVHIDRVHLLLRLIDERDAEIAALNTTLEGAIKVQVSQERELQQQDAELARPRSPAPSDALERARALADRYYGHFIGLRVFKAFTQDLHDDLAAERRAAIEECARVIDDLPAAAYENRFGPKDEIGSQNKAADIALNAAAAAIRALAPEK